MKSLKQYIVSAALALLSSGVFAQFTLNVNYSPMIPMTGYSGDIKPTVIGGNAKIKYELDNCLKFSLGVGFYGYNFDKLIVDNVLTPVEDVSLAIIPVTAGVDFFFTTTKIQPFVSLDFGYALTMQSESAYQPKTNRNNVVIAPAFGIAYEMNEKVSLAGALRNNIVVYEFKDIPDYNQPFQALGVELGLNYKF